jgi:hypothetical protein
MMVLILVFVLVAGLGLCLRIERIEADIRVMKTALAKQIGKVRQDELE